MKRGQMPGGEKSFAESAIPLILIAVLLVFIAGKIGLVDLSGVPVIGSLFPKPLVKVAVLGRSSLEMKELLSAEDYKMSGIYYQGDLPPEVILFSGALSSYDVVILQGVKECDRKTRRAVADFVKSGKKLIVIGDACTKVPDDPSILGWDFAGLGEVMPVEYAGVIGHTITSRRIPSPVGEFKIVMPDHPILPGAQLNYPFYGSLFDVVPSHKVNFDILAIVTNYDGKSKIGTTTLAVVESKGWFGGKTIYFAFDPASTAQRSGGRGRNILLNTFMYLRGSK
ncbi:hypothetical protein HY991_02400 [Candidatus Micrarchaeota archaeon]|nr:hypothetical protein [Candidatus Micrarchaeota archaeon]